MNNGMFESVQQSIEDRLGHIEGILPLLARLSEQQRFIDQIQQLSQVQAALTQEDAMIKSSLQSFVEAYNTSHAKELEEHKSFFLFMQDMSNKYAAMFRNQENAFGQTKSDIEASKTLIHDALAKVDELAFSFKSHPKLLKLEESLAISNTSLDRHETEIQDLKSEIIKLKDVIAKTGQSIIEIKSSNAELKLDIESLQHNLERLTTMLCASLRDQDAEIRQVKISTLQSVDAKLASLPQPEKVDIEQIRKLVAQDVELFSLDAKNAALKSGINESKIVLLEKKVEQLFLMINKIELK